MFKLIKNILERTAEKLHTPLLLELLDKLL